MENLKTVLYWFSGFEKLEIILIEQDSVPRISESVAACCDQYIFMENAGLFNRAKVGLFLRWYRPFSKIVL